MYKSHKYFSVHDKILYQAACHRPIDLKRKLSIFTGKLESTRYKEGKTQKIILKDTKTSHNPSNAALYLKVLPCVSILPWQCKHIICVFGKPQ